MLESPKELPSRDDDKDEVSEHTRLIFQGISRSSTLQELAPAPIAGAVAAASAGQSLRRSR